MTKTPDRRAAVALIGTLSWPQNAYIARALYDDGWRVEIYEANAVPASLSGWLRGGGLIDFPLCGSPANQQLLIELAEREDISWILPLDEPSIEWCMRTLGANTKLLPCLTKVQQAILSGKSSMTAFAESVGTRVPRSQLVSLDLPLQDQALQFGYPLVLKGEVGQGGTQVAICMAANELSAAIAKVSCGQRLLQTYVAGQSWSAGGFFVDGEPVRIHTYRIEKEYPPRSGPATYVSQEVREDLEDAFFRLSRGLRWTGYMQADFILDNSDRFYFLEINPRPWGSMTAALAAGTPIFSPLLDHLSGRTPSINLKQKNRWHGWVFPKPLPAMAYRRNFLGLIGVVTSVRFWRSLPPTNKDLLYYFAQLTVWAWRAGSRKKAD